MQIENLISKNIKDFTAEDTIYVRGSGKGSNLFLCQFISYDEKKQKVTAKAIKATVNPEIYSYDINKGLTFTSSIQNCALYGSAKDNNRRGFYHWFNTIGYALDPMEEYKIVENEMHISKHPSFAVIRAGKVSGGEKVLFGSSLKHGTTVTISISKATHDRGLNNDWISANEELIEVEMSQIQFSEFITTMNAGTGIPCTLRHHNRVRVPDPPYKSKVDIFHEEFSARMHNMGVDMHIGLVNALDLLKNKPSLNKGDREIIVGAMEGLVSQLKSTIPFIAEQFKEQMNDTIVEAKAEIEAFVEHKIRSTGIQALKSGLDFPLLESTTIKE